jgi:mannose-6-phosphate isomerase-like protein (cupin superfamily)
MFSTRSALLFLSSSIAIPVIQCSSGSDSADFDYDTAPRCYPAGHKNPARVYVPYYDMFSNVDCSNRDDYPDPFLVQCGLVHQNKNTMNWAYGREHFADIIPGDEDGSNWITMSEMGKSQYATNGFMFLRFVMKEEGSLRSPHWHSNAAEFVYITRGTARVTVTGLPKTNAEFRDPRYNLRRGENCRDEVNHLWWLEDHYDRHHKGRSNHHGGLRSSDENDDDDHHESSSHSHSKSKKNGSKHHSSSGDHHDHEDSHSHDYYHSKKKKGSKSAHFHSDQHSHKGRWWDEWTERNCTRTSETQDRNSETFLVYPGDAFYSPVGYHHYYEGVDPTDPLVGIAMFDAKDVNTFYAPQVMKAMPKDVLSKVLGVSEAKMEAWYQGKERKLEKRDLWEQHDPQEIWKSASLAEAAQNDFNEHLQFKIHGMNYRELVHAPRPYATGAVRTRAVDANNHKPLEMSKFSFAYTEIAPGAMLEPYWVDNADELIYVLSGEDVEIVRSSPNFRKTKRNCKDVFMVREGYLAIHEIASTWVIRNKHASKTVRLMRMFNNNMPSLTPLSEAFHSLPLDVLNSAFHY